jgi:hypothetical protein
MIAMSVTAKKVIISIRKVLKWELLADWSMVPLERTVVRQTRPKAEVGR